MFLQYLDAYFDKHLDSDLLLVCIDQFIGGDERLFDDFKAMLKVYEEGTHYYRTQPYASKS